MLKDENSGFNPSAVALVIVSLIVGITIVGSVLIPVIFEINDSGADHDVQSGNVYRFTPEVGTQSTITFSGTASEYTYWDDGEICVACPDGYYELTLTILVQSPGVYQEETLTFWFGDLTPKNLIYLVPVFLLIGFIIMALRKIGISTDYDNTSYDNY